MNINDIRWKRIEILDIDFNFIKSIISEKFGYEVREVSLRNFLSNMKEYKNLDIDKLLFYIEDKYYNRLSILSMKPLKKEPEYPVYEELINPTFNLEFKRKNRIIKQENNEFIGELDNIFKVTYYYENERFVEIKLSKIFQHSYRIDNEGIIEDITENIYDCFKVIIDLEDKLIFMFYNDLPINSSNNGYEYTNKKKAFYQLFTNATKGNILSYIISDSLTKYFLEYVIEVENQDIKKLVSLVEATNLIGARKATRSISHEYKHDECSINAIKSLVIDKGYCISAIECKLKSNLIKLKNFGEICIEKGFFSKEVLESVCKEFIEGHEIYKFYNGKYCESNK